IDVDGVAVALGAGMLAERFTAELGYRHVFARVRAFHHADDGVARNRDHRDDHGVALAIEHHAAARAGPLDRQRALVEKAVGIRASEPFAIAEPLAGLAHITDGNARDFGERSEQRVVGTPADRVDTDLQNVIAGQGDDRGLLALRAGGARSALAF